MKKCNFVFNKNYMENDYFISLKVYLKIHLKFFLEKIQLTINYFNSFRCLLIADKVLKCLLFVDKELRYLR